MSKYRIAMEIRRRDGPVLNPTAKIEQHVMEEQTVRFYTI